MESIWTADRQQPHFPKLLEDKQTDVLVIGGGMTGILCTYLLRQAGIDCILLEAKEIGSGTTHNTTAKLTVQHGLLYAKLIQQTSLEKAREYLDANRAALNTFKALCQKMDCDFSETAAYLYTQDQPEILYQEAAAYKKLGLPAQVVKDVPLPFPTAGAVRLDGQAQFHPMKFLRAIAQNLPIYEQTFVKTLKDGQAVTADGVRVTAKQIIVATHFPFLDPKGAYFLKMYQHRSYVIALKGAPDVKGMYMDTDKKGFSFRMYNDLLLLGGGAHRTGKKGGGFQALEQFATKNYPQAEIQYRWAAQDCMTLDGVPYIGRYTKNMTNIYVATGFNKWGMTTAMAAAMRLRDIIQNGAAHTDSVFSPSRSMLTPQLLVNIWEATVHLLAPLPRRCTHLGCALRWNPAERSWDCACHGSRFDKKGGIIDNPAKRRKHFG